MSRNAAFRDRIIQFVIVNHEGLKYTNRASDKGGPTKFGITLKALSKFRGHQCSAEDVKNLTIGEATACYVADYWDGSNVEKLPQGLWHLYYDITVNSGEDDACKILQRALVDLGWKVTVDGRFGPATLAATDAACAAHGYKEVVHKMANRRKNFYRQIVKADPSQMPNFNGWLARADWFLNNELKDQAVPPVPARKPTSEEIAAEVASLAPLPKAEPQPAKVAAPAPKVDNGLTLWQRIVKFFKGENNG